MLVERSMFDVQFVIKLDDIKYDNEESTCGLLASLFTLAGQFS